MNKSFAINDRMIGLGSSTFVIAEIGSNHDQNINQAKELIDASVQAGADAVKFQLFRADDFYQPGEEYYDIMKSVALNYDWFLQLCDYARSKNVVPLASPFSNEAVDLMVQSNCPAIKIASSETVNLKLLKKAAKTNLPLIISSGMCNIADLYEAITVINNSGGEDVSLLQCTALYPTPPAKVHLNVMDSLKQIFQVPVGFSDHTLGIHMPIAAVARGACVIEKHITLSRDLKGPDHSYAIEPAEFKNMVQNIREVELIFGSSLKEMLPEERQIARREGLQSKNGLLKGDVLSDDTIQLARPALGIDGRFASFVQGQKLNKDLQAGEAINWKDIEL